MYLSVKCLHSKIIARQCLQHNWNLLLVSHKVHSYMLMEIFGTKLWMKCKLEDLFCLIISNSSKGKRQRLAISVEQIFAAFLLAPARDTEELLLFHCPVQKKHGKEVLSSRVHKAFSLSMYSCSVQSHLD